MNAYAACASSAFSERTGLPTWRDSHSVNLEYSPVHTLLSADKPLRLNPTRTATACGGTMELSTDLLIKIVVLLTAIVGLYKAANFEIAQPFVVHLLGALSILVVPGVMLGFLLITNTMQKMMERPKSMATYAGQDAEIMYEISKEFWNQPARQEAIKQTIERAFETKQWAVVVKASADLNPTSQRDEVLMRATKMLKGETRTDHK
jgi:hypothetical protein